VKKVLLILAVAIVIVGVLAAPAIAKNAPGHENPNAAVKFTDYDSRLGVLDYLGNNGGFHLWFTVEEDTILAGNTLYTLGNSYHNIYKYQVDDPSNWEGPIDIPDLEPYNLDESQALGPMYYKVWDVTNEVWLVGSE